MDTRIYWIWLQQAIKYGNYKIKNICDLYDNNIESFFKDGERNWRLCGFFTSNDLDALNSSSVENALQILDQCHRLSYDVVVPFDSIYPENLWNIANPPAVIYVSGNKSVLTSKLNISVVGTRNASVDGTNTAEKLSFKLAKYGATIVSGGAVGIDCAAHKGAIRANKPTIAVLGCGINFNYLSKNSNLRYQISQNGALISEYPPDFPAHNYNFPMRNRIISGLSVATIVVEAGKKSGSLITANLANDQGRDVFVVPTNIHNSSLCSGAISLIEDGAKIVTHVKSLVEYYKCKYYAISPPITLKNHHGCESSNNPDTEQIYESKAKHYNLTPNATASYDLLCQYKKLHVDKLCNLLNLKIRDILSALMELEIYKLIKICPGNFYELL